jgi:threonine dehydratase
VVAEGAGAASVAAALWGAFDGKRVACIVSGGNIDMDKLATILRGEVP